MSSKPQVDFEAQFTNQTGTELTIWLEFYDALALFDTSPRPAPVRIEWGYNEWLRYFAPRVWGGIRGCEFVLVVGETLTLPWTDAWHLRIQATATIERPDGTTPTRQSSYLLSMDSTFWSFEPAPLKYSYIVQPETGDHVLIYENHAFDGSLLVYEWRTTVHDKK